jgi:hypothetical protein
VTLGDYIHIAKVGGKVRYVVEDLDLMECVAVPMEVGHAPMIQLKPTTPFGIVDNLDEIHQKLTQNFL